jgi:hypothetical protein
MPSQLEGAAMATRSPADGSAKNWKDIVELARRLDADVASGLHPSPKEALLLARAVLARKGPPSAPDAD